MKLIRLTTTRRDGMFEADVPELKIEPKSQIALLNASFEAETEGIIIDATNNGVELTVNGEVNVRKINLPNGVYNDRNYQDLIDAMNSNFNKSLSYDRNGDVGVEINCGVMTSKKMTIGYRNAKWLTENRANEIFKLNNVNTTSGANNATFSGSVAPFTTNNMCFMYSKNHVAKGTGQVACRCKTLTSGGGVSINDGFYIGLTEVDMRNYTDDKFDLPQFKIAVKCASNGVDIGTYKNEQLTASTIPSNPGNPSLSNRDFVAVRISGGFIQAVVHQAGDADSSGTVIGDIAYDGKTPLYPVIVFRGNLTDTIIDQVKTYYSPYGDVDGDDNQEALGVSPQFRRGTSLTNNYLGFTNQAGSTFNNDLSSFFGYTSARLPPVNFVKSSDYDVLATNLFSFSNLSDAYLIEMLNIPITSWDGETSKKRSLIAVIPQSNNTNANGLVEYEASTPIFLDIDNMSSMLMRNVQCRIVKNDTSTLLLRGLASLTLLIKSPNE